MRWSILARSALLSVAMCCVATPEAEAIEIFGPPRLAAHVADGAVTQVRFAGGAGVRRGGGMRGGGAYRGRAGYGYRGGYGRYGYRGGYGYRGYGYRGYGYGGYGYGGYGYGAAAIGAAAIGAAAAAHNCWIDSYGNRVCNQY